MGGAFITKGFRQRRSCPPPVSAVNSGGGRYTSGDPQKHGAMSTTSCARQSCPKGPHPLPPSTGTLLTPCPPREEVGPVCIGRSRHPGASQGWDTGILSTSFIGDGREVSGETMSHQEGKLCLFNGKINLTEPEVAPAAAEGRGILSSVLSKGLNPFPARSHPLSPALLSGLVGLHRLPATSAAAKPSGCPAIGFNWDFTPLASGPVSPSPRMASSPLSKDSRLPSTSPLVQAAI